MFLWSNYHFLLAGLGDTVCAKILDDFLNDIYLSNDDATDWLSVDLGLGPNGKRQDHLGKAVMEQAVEFYGDAIAREVGVGR